MVWLLVPIPHSFWPQEAPKSAFFRARTPKCCWLKMLKISHFQQFSKYHKFGLRNRMEMTYPSKWRHWVDFFDEKLLSCNADIRHTYILEISSIVEKVGNFTCGAKMARGARSGARYQIFVLAKLERYALASFWWVWRFHTTYTSSWLFKQSIIKFLMLKSWKSAIISNN